MQAKNLPSFPWQILLDWYEKNGRHDLPWRRYKGGRQSLSRHPDEERIHEITETLDSSLHSEGRSQRHNQSSGILHLESIIYRVWLSEILLQQTQASRVVDFFNRMIERFPTIESLAKTDYETFFPYYQGLGYYSRARNILKTAKIIHGEYNNVFPTESSLLTKLPGVGPYTAEAIRAFGYEIPTLSWDTNLEKVFARYYHGRRDEKLSKREKEQVEEDFYRFINDARSKTMVRETSPLLEETERDTSPHPSYKEGNEQSLVRAINNALMDFAALIDLKNPTNINWGDYPIRSGKFYETRGSLEPQETKKSISFPTPDATIIVILHKDHKVYYGSLFTPQSPLLQRGEAVPKTPSPSGDKGRKEYLHDYSEVRAKQSWGEVGYSPFILPPSLTRDTREYVKSYFREKYRLELSVRPPHKKWLSEEGKPYIAVNAQVQVGEVKFEKWSKKGGRYDKVAKRHQEINFSDDEVRSF